MTTYAKHRFHILDGMRGLAALLVMLTHFYTVNRPAFLSNANLAVDFFFMLSGFVIYHSYADKLLSGMPIGDYLARRIARLYPMMAVGLLLGLAGFYLSIATGETDYFKRDALAATLSNLFFAPFLNDKTNLIDGHASHGNLFPGDGPLWSIFFELIASIGFIALVRARQSALSKFCSIALACVFMSAATRAFMDHTFALYAGVGWRTDEFLGGFARVFYSFIAGMLIYQLRSTPPIRFGGGSIGCRMRRLFQVSGFTPRSSRC